MTIPSIVKVYVPPSPAIARVIMQGQPGPEGPVGGFSALQWAFDGGTDDLVVGSYWDSPVPFDCVIIAATVLALQASPGSIVIGVGKSNYASFPTYTSIAASARPSLSSAIKSYDATLTGWNKTLLQGDYLRASIDSNSGIKRALLILDVDQTP